MNKKETWKEILLNGRKPTSAYVVSNLGRFGVKVGDKVRVKTLKPIKGSYRYNIRVADKSKALFISREVARAFVKKTSSNQKVVIHKDHNYLNNRATNLKWATRSEHRAHAVNSPRSVEAKKQRAFSGSVHGKVLNEKKVVALKKMIWDPKRKLTFKQIARQFNVSEMQVYRIKSGEFWYHIKVENEPARANYKANLAKLLRNKKISLKNSSIKR